MLKIEVFKKLQKLLSTLIQVQTDTLCLFCINILLLCIRLSKRNHASIDSPRTNSRQNELFVTSILLQRNRWRLAEYALT